MTAMPPASQFRTKATTGRYLKV